jgi:hypothetical protein
MFLCVFYSIIEFLRFSSVFHYTERISLISSVSYCTERISLFSSVFYSIIVLFSLVYSIVEYPRIPLVIVTLSHH